MTPSGIITRAISPLASIPGVFDYVSRKLLVTFNYHEINDNPSQFCNDFNLNVRPEIFIKQLIWIKKYFNVISPQQLISGNFKPPAAVITFDDGFAGVFNQGARILKSLNLPAVVFLNMAPVYGQTCWSALTTYLCKYNNSFRSYISTKYDREIRSDLFLYLTQADVQEFLELNGHDVLKKAQAYHGEFASENDLIKSAEYGLFLGNHLLNHYNAAVLSECDLTQQYILNESLISKFKNFVPFFSYPFGQPRSCYGTETHKLLLSLGAQRLFTAFPLFNKDQGARIIHRTAMFNDINSESIFRSHVLTPAYLNYIFRRRRWGGVDDIV